MSAGSARLSLVFSSIGHTFVHFFTAFYAFIVLALEEAWTRPYHELLELWVLGSALVGLCALPAGWLGDRWSAAGMMVVYFLGMGAAAILCGLVDGPAALLVGLAAIGLFASIYHPVGIAWLVRNAESRGRALGINGVFGSIGIASAGVVSGFLIDHYGWRAAFWVPGALCLACGLGLLLCLRLGLVQEGGAVRRSEPPASRGDMLRVFAILLFTMLCMGLIFQATQTALPKVFDLRLRDIAGAGTFGIGAIVASVFVVGGVTQILGGLLADRYPLKPIYVGVYLLQVPVLAGLAAASGLSLIGAAVLIVLLSTVGLPAENMLLARYTPARHHSLAFGVKFVLSFGAAPLAIAGVALAEARSGEFFWLFLGMAALAGAALAAAALLPAERRPSPAPLAAE